MLQVLLVFWLVEFLKSEKSFWMLITYRNLLIAMLIILLAKKKDKDTFITPPDLFEISRSLVLNEINSKLFWKGFMMFLKIHTDVRNKWITKKLKQLFKLKSKNPHPSCIIHKAVFTCWDSYIGKMKRNAEIRCEKHQDVNKDP